jgi:ribonuclease HI
MADATVRRTGIMGVEVTRMPAEETRRQGSPPQVEIYTDGACSGNPGPGGWAAVLIYNGKTKEISGGERQTTNQRMELTAAVEALKALKVPCDVRIYSDSAYLINCFRQKWYVTWQKNGWKNSKGDPVQNQDLWQSLLKEMERHRVTFEKVKGHAGVEFNERCDTLARAAVPK